MDWTTYVLFGTAFVVVAYYQFIKPSRSKETSTPRGGIKGSAADRESSSDVTKKTQPRGGPLATDRQPQSNTRPTRAIAEPVCSLCARALESMDTTARYAAVIGGPSPTLYKGVVCTKCHAVICLECQGHPSSRPCKSCGGEVLPATPDVLPSEGTRFRSTRSYLYLLQKSRAPSQNMMQTVLRWWREEHGPHFGLLGGRQVDNVPATADVYVVTLMRLTAEGNGFAQQADKMGYKTITVDGGTPGGETIGVCYFLDQNPPKELQPPSGHKGPWCRGCGAAYESDDVLPRHPASYDDQVNTTYCPKCGSEKIY